MRKKITMGFLAVAGLASFAQVSQAQSLVNSFVIGDGNGDGSFTAGTLDGQGGGLDGTVSAFENAQNANVVLTGLDFADPNYFAESGGSVNIAGDVNGRQGQQISSPVTDTTDGTVYLSFLLQTDTENSGSYRAFELHDGGFADGANRNFQLGFQNGDFNSADTNFGFRLQNTGDIGSLGVNDEDVNLFVARFDLSAVAGGDSVTVFQNPTLTTTGLEPTAEGVTLDGQDIVFDRYTFALFGGSNGISFDEVRFGSSFASVTGPTTAVPEPSSLGLLSIGSVVLLRRRKR